MFTIHKSSTAQHVRRNCRFTLRRLAPRADAATLHAALSAVAVILVAKLELVEGALEARLMASADLTVLDEDLDLAVADLVARVLLLVGRDRSHPSFMAAFPTAPSAATKDIASDEQTRYVRAAIAALRADPLFASLSAEIDAVEVKLNALEAGRAAREARKQDEQLARQQAAAAAESARLVFNTVHPTLKLLYPGRKGLIKSMFLPSERVEEVVAADTAA